MFILGVSCYYHDSAAVLLKDGQLIAAAEEERFSRVKHDNGYPKHAIEFCLKQGGITSKDLDYVVFYEKPLVKFERILMTTLGGFPRLIRFSANRWWRGSTRSCGPRASCAPIWMSIRRRFCLSSITSRTPPAPCLRRRLKKPPC